MNNTNLQVSNVVSNVPENGYGHDKKTELNLLDLFLELLYWCSFKYLLHFPLFLFLISHFLCQSILFFPLFPLLYRFGNMFSNLFITIINDFNQELSTLVDSGTMEH